MARKHRLKRTADNPFTKLTGKPVIKLSGASNCIVVESKMTTCKPLKQSPTKIVAAYLYITHPQLMIEFGFTPMLPSTNHYTFQLSEIKKVIQTCGVDQCVHPDHLQVIIKEQKYGW